MRKRLYLVGLLLLCLIAGASLYFYSVKNKYSSDIEYAIVSLQKPPKEGSSEFKHDEEMYQKGLLLRKTARLDDAQAHAGINKLDKLEKYFSDSIGHIISKDRTPKTHALLEDVFYVSRKAAGKAKKRFERPRPFVIHPEDNTCLPDNKAGANPYGSYPSFHAASAYSVGITLSKLLPNKSALILEKTNQLGASRWICGYHWYSDVEASKNMVNGIFNRFLEDNDFRNRISDAKTELSLQE